MSWNMTNDRAAVVARLRAAAADRAHQAEADGREQGRRWAEEYADPVQLRHLEAADEQIPAPWADHLEAIEARCGDNPPVALHRLFEPVEADDREIGWYWEDVFCGEAGRLTEPAYAAGFVLGALEVWREVKADVSA